jgi:poly-gamma-glutamate synthesis protein (capsule biosynthesis protein)
MRILFCGDIAISGVDNFEYSDEVTNLFNEQDLVVGNLEAVITKSDNKLPLHPAYLKTDFHSLNLLDPFKVLCIANNHTLDYQDEGLKDTINHLDKMGISHFGAGEGSEHENKPLLF